MEIYAVLIGIGIIAIAFVQFALRARTAPLDPSLDGLESNLTISQIEALLKKRQRSEARSSFVISSVFYLLGLASSAYSNEIAQFIRSTSGDIFF